MVENYRTIRLLFAVTAVTAFSSRRACPGGFARSSAEVNRGEFSPHANAPSSTANDTVKDGALGFLVVPATGAALGYERSRETDLRMKASATRPMPKSDNVPGSGVVPGNWLVRVASSPTVNA